MKNKNSKSPMPNVSPDKRHCIHGSSCETCPNKCLEYRVWASRKTKK